MKSDGPRSKSSKAQKYGQARGCYSQAKTSSGSGKPHLANSMEMNVDTPYRTKSCGSTLKVTVDLELPPLEYSETSRSSIDARLFPMTKLSDVVEEDVDGDKGSLSSDGAKHNNNFPVSSHHHRPTTLTEDQRYEQDSTNDSNKVCTIPGQ